MTAHQVRFAQKQYSLDSLGSSSSSLSATVTPAYWNRYQIVTNKPQSSLLILVSIMLPWGTEFESKEKSNTSSSSSTMVIQLNLPLLSTLNTDCLTRFLEQCQHKSLSDVKIINQIIDEQRHLISTKLIYLQSQILDWDNEYQSFKIL